MNNLETELVYISNLMFGDKEDCIEEINEAGGVVRVADEDGDFVYYGADGRLFGINKYMFVKMLELDNLITSSGCPTDDDLDKPTYFDDFRKASEARYRKMTDYLEKLRNDIANGKIAV